ncbi:hypothetical protein PMIT1318_00630 [Prochlorococcus marinus str. MIT 1318]|uniref:hypothetical protein n=1 Tax=Prochlorococcus TaxID=1218 RepID=UPI0007B396A2|nr:hypothetical protein [Prochlorococcus marinus]KZR73042.1 hypothetical protein PMIT1318_00630 [Prochlorococcus marinus str. MIT 1318]
MALSNVITALFADPNSSTTTLTKQNLKKDIWDAYQASQDQLSQAREELLPAALFGGVITLLIVLPMAN